MTLNEHQVRRVEAYLKNSGLKNRLLTEDFLDHICCMIEDKMDGGRRFDASLAEAFDELPVNEIKNMEHFTLKLINMETSFSNRTSALAALPFLFWGCTWLVSGMGTGMPYLILAFSFVVAVLSMFCLFCIGWYKDFPGWSFPAVGFCILFSLFFMMVTVPSISNAKLGFYAWLPFAVSLIVCLIIRPSATPVKKIVSRIKNEPSLILFILYGFAPFFISLFCDEMHSVAIIPIAVISTAVLSFGLYSYLRSGKTRVKVISLIASAAGALAVTMITCYIYWGT
jgi:hypothetical protein